MWLGNIGDPRLAGLMVGVLLAVGCGDDEAADPVVVTVSGTVIDLLSGDSLAGVEVCVVEPEGLGCATSDADGQFVLEGLPANTQLLVEGTKAGYVSVLIMAKTQDTDGTASGGTLLESTFGLIATAFGETVTAGQGHVAVVAFAYDPDEPDPPQAGVAFSIDAASGSGPHYLDDNNLPDPSATETSAAGGGSFLNLDPGTYTLTTSHASLSCDDRNGFAWGAGEDTFTIRVDADYATTVSVQCD